MNKELIIGEVTEIASDESNDIYMSLHIRLITDKKNLNGAKFTKSFINSVVNNGDFYNGMPLVAERKKLEHKIYSSLGHAKNEDGTFDTDQIGSFISFYSKENKSKNRTELFGVAKVFKRFPKVCEAIQELYEQDKLFFSVEVAIGEYQSKTAYERVIDAHEDNQMFGDCLVSYPAEKTSVAEILIAENKEGENMKNKKTEKEFFEKAVVQESSELDMGQVRNKVYNKCREALGDNLYDYYCSEFGYDYLILRNYESAELYKVDYTVANDEIEVSEMYKVNRTYIVASDESSEKSGEEISAKDDSKKEISAKDDSKKDDSKKDDSKDESKKDESKKESAEKDDSKDESAEVENSELEKLKSEIASKDQKILELTQNVNLLSEKIIAKDSEISTLNKVKGEFEILKTEVSNKEKKATKELLKAKYSKLLTKEEMESDEVINAIEELNADFLKELVVNNVLASLEGDGKEVITSSINDPIELGGSDIVSKYITRN